MPRRNHPGVEGDNKPFDPKPWLKFPRVILWGAPHFANKLPPGSWLVWDKRFPNGTAFLADGEAAWMNHGAGLYIRSITSQGFIRPEVIQHPTQKPVEIMSWCIEKAGMPQVIFDPFLGSGTTAVAAKKLGRHFIGCEISPDYCRIAEQRLLRLDAQPGLFEPPKEKPKQESLVGLRQPEE